MKNVFLASTVSFIVMVSYGWANSQTLTANFNGCDSGYAPLCITFTDASTSSAGNPIVARQWTFQGGIPATASIANPYVCFNSAGTYSVSLKVSTALGSQKTFVSSNCVVVLSGTSINENYFTDQISVYPNPFSSQTVFQANKPLRNATLTVIDCFGQIVAQKQNISGNAVLFSRDNLASGLYFVRLAEENKIIAIEKLIITEK